MGPAPIPMTTHTLADLAALVGATLEGDGSKVVHGPAALGDAGEHDVSFLGSPRYEAQLATTRAAGVLVARDVRAPRQDLTLLRCDHPGRAFTAVVRAFAPDEPVRAPGIDPSARIANDAVVDASAHVGPHCVVEEGARIASGVVLVSRVHVGRGASVGESTVLHPGVVLYPGVAVGARCILHAGCVIGSDGFGFDPTEAGWSKVPQCGTVHVEDDVEIGANSTVDRARFGTTRIGRGAKLDNLVHVGHNCVLEEGVLLCAHVGVAGSTRIGRGTVLGGQAGVNGHVVIGERARIAGGAGVIGDVPGGEDWAGWPARPFREVMRGHAAVRRLPELVKRLRKLEERLARLEGGEV